MAISVVEVPPGGKTAPVKHLYEAFFYTLSGYGTTIIHLPDGEKQTFESGAEGRLQRYRSTASTSSSTAPAASRRACPAPTMRR